MAVTLLFGGCRRSRTDLPAELSSALSSLSGSLRLTWYLSSELAGEDSLKAVDGILKSLADAAESSGIDVTAVVRPPMPGERKPSNLLPLPATDARGNTVVLWSALVLDWKENRTVIPDMLDSHWLPLDLTRAILDLAAGAPLSVGVLDGSADGSGLPGAMLSGRWDVSPWDPSINSPEQYDVLLIRDGPGLKDFGAALPSLLDQYIRQGGGILMAPSSLSDNADEGPSPAGLWAEKWTGDGNTGEVLYVDDPLFLNPSAYSEGIIAFRELDAALLLAARRGGLLSLITPETEPLRTPTSRPAGSRLHKEAGRFQDGNAPDPGKVNRVVVHADSEAEPLYALERSREGWTLVSGDWRLPGRSDRIESFLSRLEEGSHEIWQPGDILNEVAADSFGGLRIELIRKTGKTFVLAPKALRFAGGGVYIATRPGTALWPLLSPEELEGDPRYWMERRLFPDTVKIIRAELRTESRLYWRIHQRGDTWIFSSDRNPGTVVETGSALDFLGRISRAESTTIAPFDGVDSSPLVLMVESDTGRRFEFRLSDRSGGSFAATSSGGLEHILKPEFVEFLLEGPSVAP